MPWFCRDPLLLAEVEGAIASYPDLRLVKGEATVRVCGTFPIVHDGKVLDRFQVEVSFRESYPRTMPRVMETGGRIPKTLDRHVFPTSGFACLQVPEEWLTDADRSFRRFLKVPVHNYFLGQALVELGQPWPFGERSHGIKGLYEAYGEILGEADPATIERLLQVLAARDPKGHWRCPCGSGERLRKCCQDRINDLRDHISPEVARSILVRLNAAGGALPGDN